MRSARAALAVLALATAGPVRASYRETAVENGGRIVGRVRVVGEVTPLPPAPVYKEKAYCGETMPDERLVVGKGGGLAGAVVYLVGVEAGKPIPRASLVLDNRGCAFVPHVLTGSVGQTLEIHNADPFLHDAHALLGARTLFNLAILRDRTVRRTLADVGVTHVNCNLRHTWMHAHLFVTDGPYATVTDADGRYAIDDVPPGTYTLAVWHELLGDRERPVTVAAWHELAADFELDAVAPAAP